MSVIGKNNQSGFTIVESLLVIIIIILICFVGWFIYHTDHKTKSTATTTATSARSSDKSASPSTTSVVKIPELGIEITVPNSLKDLIYTASSPTTVNGENSIAVGFSTPQLAAADPGCTAAHDPLGNLSKTDGQYPANATDENSSGQLVKQFPTFYIAYNPSQGECASPSNASAIAVENNTPTLSKPDITTANGTTTVNGPPTLDFTVQLL